MVAHFCSNCFGKCQRCSGATDDDDRRSYIVLVDRQVVSGRTFTLLEAMAYVSGRKDALPEADRDGFKIEIAALMVRHYTKAETEAKATRTLKDAAARDRAQAKQKRDRELIRLGREVERQRKTRPTRKPTRKVAKAG